MRIALVNTMVPHVRGGAEILVDDLFAQLQSRGYDVTLFRVPFPLDFGIPLVQLMESVQLLRLEDYDKLITFKFPAYCISHPDHVVWLFHQFRQVYELWNTPYGLEDTPKGRVLRDTIRQADQSLQNVRKVFTIAQENAKRLQRYSGIDSTLLPHLPQNIGTQYYSETGDYLFYPSRITGFKRQLLAVQAMKYVKTDVKLLITGACEEAEYEKQLRNEIETHHLEGKVRLETRWLTEEEKLRYLSACLGVFYLAYQEDSCGMVSMEAFYAHKPVITCTDSGGTLELVEDQKTGFVCAPDPQAIAKVMDALYLDQAWAKRVGDAAYEEILRRNLTWDHTIGRLLS